MLAVRINLQMINRKFNDKLSIGFLLFIKHSFALLSLCLNMISAILQASTDPAFPPTKFHFGIECVNDRKIKLQADATSTRGWHLIRYPVGRMFGLHCVMRIRTG